MSREAILYLRDIVDSARKVLRYTQGLSKDEFLADERTYDAVLRNLGIIGEAVARVPKEVRDGHPEIEWRRIAGFRNIVVHQYFGVDDDVLWSIVTGEVGPLLERAEAILAREQSNLGQG